MGKKNHKQKKKHPTLIPPFQSRLLKGMEEREHEMFRELFGDEHCDQESVLSKAEHEILKKQERNNSCAPLLILETAEAAAPVQGEVMHGVFIFQNNAFVFSPTQDGQITGTYPCSDLMPEVQALLMCFSVFDLVAILRGEADGNRFWVSEIHSGGITNANGKEFSEISDVAIQAICNRIRYDARQLADEALFRSGYLLSQEAELRALYPVIKGNLSPAQRDWVESSFTRLHVPLLCKDEKQHILRAVSFVLNVNWKPRNIELQSYSEIKERLDRRFYGMESVKTQILEVAAQLRNNRKLPQWGILLNGPAGVGKTAIAEEIAKILRRNLIFIDLSTNSDPDALAGSSRIYSNAKPGYIAERILDNRDSNCVMLLNELDKAADRIHGCIPTDTFLSLVDKTGFSENYLEADIDTGNIFFIATCNDINRISRPLQDRFIRIDIPGYSTREKHVIFTDYVLPRTLEANGLDETSLQVSEAFTEQLCKYYAVEPSVRDLEKYAERLVRSFLLQRDQGGAETYVYDVGDLVRLFGSRKARSRTLASAPGLAKTIVCHEHRSFQSLIQATVEPGTGDFEIYGAANDFHRDCCRVAYACARKLSNADFSHSDVTLFITSSLPGTDRNDLGCAAFMAIMSAVTKRILPSDAVFVGGCDLMGNMFWDETELTAVMNRAEDAGDTSIFGPIGLAELASECDPGELQIIEAYNAALLFDAFAEESAAS